MRARTAGQGGQGLCDAGLRKQTVHGVGERRYVPNSLDGDSLRWLDVHVAEGVYKPGDKRAST